MSLEKTMMGNPTGENPKKPKFERMGGIDVGGSMGKMYERAAAIPETPTERAERQQAAARYEAQVVQQMRNKIGAGEQARPVSELRNMKKNAVIMGMPAITPEKLAEYKQAQDEAEAAEKKIKGGFWGGVRRFFGGA